MESLKERQDAVTKARSHAQSLSAKISDLRGKLMDVSLMITGVGGDLRVELDLAQRQYEKAVDALEAAIYALGDEGEGDE